MEERGRGSGWEVKRDSETHDGVRRKKWRQKDRGEREREDKEA